MTQSEDLELHTETKMQITSKFVIFTQYYEKQALKT